MGVSGNSVAGKGFQIFTVSEELLAKVTEAVQAGEKEARSSGNIQSFEVFCHGFRQNISLGRIMVVPPAVCNSRETFPTALLNGALVRIFGTGGEERADLIDKKIGESEFDEYSQADFDTLKQSLFVDEKTGKEACLIVFAPNWMNSREYISFHFTKDGEKLKNNLRHQVFSAYYNPAVSSAFNALMTNVNTTKVDVTDITPKLSHPFLTENPLKEYPRLDKQAGYRKETILLNRKTADAVTKQTLDPQELDVFDALDTALEQSLLPDADGAQGEGGYKAPEAQQGVPRAASSDHADNCDCHECNAAYGEPLQRLPKGASKKKADENPLAAHESPFTNVGPGTEAHDKQKAMVPAAKESLDDAVKQNKDKATEPIGIAIDETGVPRSKAEEEKGSAKTAHWGECKQCGMQIEKGYNFCSNECRDNFNDENRVGMPGGFESETNLVGEPTHEPHPDCICANCKKSRGEIVASKKAHIDANGNCPGCKKAGNECSCSGCTCKAASNPSTRSRPANHPETLRVDPTRLSSAYSAAYNGGFVDKHAMPPQKVRNAMAEVGDNSKPAPHAAKDHAKQIEAGAYGDDPLNRRANEKWGTAEVKTKRSNKEVMADYIADVVATEIDEPSEAVSTKGKQARAKKESLLDKFRPKTAVELDIDSIWDAITEDMGPAPLVDVEADPTNPNPPNTDNREGFELTTPENEGAGAEEGESEAPAPSTAPRKRDVQDLPEAFRSTEPEEKKEISEGEAEQQETDLENDVTQSEEHDEDHNHEGSWRVDAKLADFVGEVADEIESEEELPGQRVSCPDCQMLSIQGVPCHEQGCPNQGARWDSDSGNWVEQRKCFECGSTVDAEDPCCSAEEFHDRMDEDVQSDEIQNECMASDKTADVLPPRDREARERGVFDSEKSHKKQQKNVFTLKQMLNPKRFPGMSGKFAAIVGYILGEQYTQPHITEMAITSDGIVMAQQSGDVGMNDMIGSYDDLKRNWDKLISVAKLSPEQKKEAAALFGSRIRSYMREGSAKKADRTIMPQETIKQTPGAYGYNDISKTTMPIAQPTTKAEGAPAWVTGSDKTADTADNGYDIDSAANPTSKETGPSQTVECHEDYNTERSEGTDRPKPGAGADIKQAADDDDAVKCEGCGKEHNNHHKGYVSELCKECERKAKGKKADTADNPANWKGGEGIIQPKTDAEVKDTTGPDAPPPGQKSSADISGDAAEAKAETVSPDTVDKDIQQPTVSVEDAAYKNGAEKVALHFMNDYDIDDAVMLLNNDPVLGKAVRFLAAFKDEVNSHSDGWAYWRQPVAAAGQLMTLIEAGVNKRRGRQSDVVVDDRAIAKAMGPIKSFMTRRGLAAGMTMPKLAADISGDMSEAKSEVDYNKAEVADDSAATDTVNPEHFAGDGEAFGGKQAPPFGSKDKEEKKEACRHDDVPVAQGESARGEQPVSNLSGAAPEASNVPPILSAKKEAGPKDALLQEAARRVMEMKKRNAAGLIDMNEMEGLCAEHATPAEIAKLMIDGYDPQIMFLEQKDADRAMCIAHGEALAEYRGDDEDEHVGSDKNAACGDDQPEEVEFDFGAGDLADIVTTEEVDE
jgi:hypothetical protein